MQDDRINTANMLLLNLFQARLCEEGKYLLCLELIFLVNPLWTILIKFLLTKLRLFVFFIAFVFLITNHVSHFFYFSM